MITPRKEEAKYTAGLCKKRLTSEVRSNPTSPIKKKEPQEVRSLLVLYPYKLIIPKTAAQTKKVLAIEIVV